LFLPVAIPVAVAVLAVSFLYRGGEMGDRAWSGAQFSTPVEVLAGTRRALISTTVDGHRIK